MNDIEVAMAKELAQFLVSPDAKGEHLGKVTHPGCRQLIEVKRGEDLERVFLGESELEEVQVFKAVFRDALGNVRIWGADDYMDLVP
jgi:hypothetical protein